MKWPYTHVHLPTGAIDYVEAPHVGMLIEGQRRVVVHSVALR
jgi:hypothetical protein